MKDNNKKWIGRGLAVVVLAGLVLLGNALFRGCKASREQAALASNTLYEIEMQRAAFNAPLSFLEWR